MKPPAVTRAVRISMFGGKAAWLAMSTPRTQRSMFSFVRQASSASETPTRRNDPSSTIAPAARWTMLCSCGAGMIPFTGVMIWQTTGGAAATPKVVRSAVMTAATLVRMSDSFTDFQKRILLHIWLVGDGGDDRQRLAVPESGTRGVAGLPLSGVRGALNRDDGIGVRSNALPHGEDVIGREEGDALDRPQRPAR